MNRRQMLKVSTGAALCAGLAVPYLCSRDKSLAPGLFHLSSEDADMIESLAQVFLDKDREAVRGVASAVDIAIRGLTPSVQEEIAQLLTAMHSRLLLGLSGGLWQNWDKADRDTIQHFLETWRFNSLSLLQTAYQALHELILAAWYGQEKAWAEIGYPGPPLRRAE